MAWELSLGQEGWDAIKNSLYVQSKKWMYDAIQHQRSIDKKCKIMLKPVDVTKEDLMQELVEQVERVNTSNNGGFVIWATSDGLATFHIDSAAAWLTHGNSWREFVKDGENYISKIGSDCGYRVLYTDM
jgi:hypothetical protein